MIGADFQPRARRFGFLARSFLRERGRQRSGEAKAKEYDQSWAAHNCIIAVTAIKSMWPDKFHLRIDSIDRLSGSDELRPTLDRGDTPDQILAAWAPAPKGYDRPR
jgi:hypothetical protein